VVAQDTGTPARASHRGRDGPVDPASGRPRMEARPSRRRPRREVPRCADERWHVLSTRSLAGGPRRAGRGRVGELPADADHRRRPGRRGRPGARQRPGCRV